MASDASLDETASSGNVFVSYSWSDRDFTQQIIALLEDEGYEAKVDRKDIAPSEEWRKRLSEMIRTSDTFLFVLTDAWLASENCRSEFDEALNAGKWLVPVLPRPLQTEPASEIASKNYIYFFSLLEGDGRGFYDGTIGLKKALRHDQVRLRLRRRYEDRANGWQRKEDSLLTADQLVQAETWLAETPADEAVPPLIRAYIAASQDERERVQRRQTRNRLLLTALGAFAVVATAIAGVTAWSAQQTLDGLATAEAEAESLAEAATEWASGTSSLAALLSDPENDGLKQGALRELQSSFDRVSEIRQLNVATVSLDISRDLARAMFHNGSIAGLDLMDTVITQATESAASQQAVDHLARAVLACVDAPSQAAIFEALSRAPASAQAEFTRDTAVDWARPGALCIQAENAICQFENACRLPEEASFDLVESTDEDSPLGILGETDTIASETDSPTLGVGMNEPVPTTFDPDFKITQIFLHISNEDDRQKAEALSLGLRAAGYTVLGIELIPAPEGRNRSVRFFYSEQGEEAAFLRDLCARLAGREGLRAWAEPDSYRVISLAGRYKNLPRNRVEIWF